MKIRGSVSLCLLFASPLGLTGCPNECEGAGCADLFTATLLTVHRGGSDVAYRRGMDPMTGALQLEGTSDQGTDWTLAIGGDHLAVGMPEKNQVLSIGVVSKAVEDILEPVLRGTLYGEESGDHHGASVALVPDMDGDGTRELWVGAPNLRGGGTDLNAGGAYLHMGLGEGWRGEVEATEARLRLISDAAMNRLGSTVLACDFDGDGLGDLVVAAPHDQTGGLLAGRVHLVSSGDLEDLPEQIQVGALSRSWHATEDGAQLGRSLACLPDLDGDGRQELAVAAPYADGGDQNPLEAQGAVYLLNHESLEEVGAIEIAAWRTLLGGEEEAYLGQSIAVGDLDGDELPDLAIGAPGAQAGAGEVVVFLGKSLVERSNPQADFHIQAAGPSDRLGRGVGLADLNGDRAVDLLAGAPRANPESDSQVLFAGTLFFQPGSASLDWDGTVEIEEAPANWQRAESYLRVGESFFTGRIDGDDQDDLVLLLGRRPEE